MIASPANPNSSSMSLRLLTSVAALVAALGCLSGCEALDALIAAHLAAQRTYSISGSFDSGTFAGQTFTGSVDIDQSSLIGTGVETLPAEAMTRLELDIFGGHFGPVARAGTSEFVDGQLNRILVVVSIPSPSEGNQTRGVGFSLGFGPEGVPDDGTGRWVGFLSTSNTIDGFGKYAFTPLDNRGDPSQPGSIGQPGQGATSAEMRRLTGERPLTAAAVSQMNFLRSDPEMEIPKAEEAVARFDLRTHYWPARNQSQWYSALAFLNSDWSYGNCWAFAAVAAMEGAYQRQFNIAPDLSEQAVVNCSGAGNPKDGGNAPSVFQWLKDKNARICTEEELPYDGPQGSCSNTGGYYGLQEWGMVGGNSRPGTAEHTDALKRALVAHGVLAASIIADEDFQTYSGGVFAGNATGDTNHAINIVGWDDSKGAWIVRNSWGDWGEDCDAAANIETDGYAYVKYGANQVGSHAAWVKVIPADVGYVKVFCQAGYVTEFNISYFLDGVPTFDSVTLTAGGTKNFSMPSRAFSVAVQGIMKGDGLFVQDKVLFYETTSGPPNKCFKTYGTIFDPAWNNNCDMDFSADAPPGPQDGYATVFCQAGYVTEFKISYFLDGVPTFDSATLSAGVSRTFTVPARAISVAVQGVMKGDGVFVSDKVLFYETSNGPPNKCFKTYGTIFDAAWNNECN